MELQPSEWNADGVQQALLGVAALCLAGVSLSVVVAPPAESYEAIYRAYPVQVWALFAVGLLAVATVFFLDPVSDDSYWQYALALGIAMYVLFTLLPLLRGWALYGRNDADVLAHLGFGRRIARTGHVRDANFYPVVHLLIAETRLLGVPARVLSVLFSTVFTPLYLAGLYLFSRAFTRDRTAAVVTLGAAVPLAYGKFHHALLPSFLSFLLVPAVLFLVVRYGRTRRRAYLALTLLATGVLVPFHPVTSLYLLLVLGVSVLARVAYRWLPLGTAGGEPLSLRPDLLVAGWIGGIWAAWYLRRPGIRSDLAIALDVTGGSQEQVSETYGADQVAMAQDLQQIALGFLDQYGAAFVLCGVAAVAVLVTLKRTLTTDAGFQEVWLSGEFVAALGVAAVTLFTYVVAYHPLRNARLAILLAVLLTGVLGAWLLRGTAIGRPRLERAALVVAVVLLLVTVPITVTNSYQAWSHMTYAEQDGTAWFYEHADEDAAAVSHHVSRKMEMFVRGTGWQQPTFVDFGPESPVPPYFGYRNHSTLGAAVPPDETPVYVVTKEYDTEYYRSLEPYLWERNRVYTDPAVRRLGNDSTVNEVYSNGGYAVWYHNDTRPASDAVASG